MRADAQHRATTLVAQAEDEAANLVDNARSDAERTRAQADEEYQRAVAAGQAEQDRLVSESEVVRRADDEAHRIVETAHSESNRLRTECDEFVDAKLGEFETTLSDLLRTVNNDRSALRRGAGVRSRGESHGEGRSAVRETREPVRRAPRAPRDY